MRVNAKGGREEEKEEMLRSFKQRAGEAYRPDQRREGGDQNSRWLSHRVREGERER